MGGYAFDKAKVLKMLICGHSFIDRVILRTNSNIRKYFHYSFIDLLIEKLNLARGFR
jgi:hypothetical protein